MSDTQHEIEGYITHIAFPVTKEELINGLLVRRAAPRLIALVERLPQDRYADRPAVRRDLEEVAHVHAREVAGARTYDEFLAVVLRHVGDVRHATKDAYNRVVEHVVHSAQQQGTLTSTEAPAMRERLEAAYADLRGRCPRYTTSAPRSTRTATCHASKRNRPPHAAIVQLRAAMLRVPVCR